VISVDPVLCESSSPIEYACSKSTPLKVWDIIIVSAAPSSIVTSSIIFILTVCALFPAGKSMPQ
jgi:hypothetical protein